MNRTVTVYADGGNDDAADTLAILENEGITYMLVDLTQDDNALEHVKSLGYAQTPVVETTSHSWAGFRPDLITAFAQSLTLDKYQPTPDPMNDLACDSCQ